MCLALYLPSNMCRCSGQPNIQIRYGWITLFFSPSKVLNIYKIQQKLYSRHVASLWIKNINIIGNLCHSWWSCSLKVICLVSPRSTSCIFQMSGFKNLKSLGYLLWVTMAYPLFSERIWLIIFVWSWYREKFYQKAPF